MITEQLIEQAKKMYPIGTKFYALNTNQECIITTSIIKEDSNSIIEFDANNKCITTLGFYHCLYSNEKWARIISLPQVINQYEIY